MKRVMANLDCDIVKEKLRLAAERYRDHGSVLPVERAENGSVRKLENEPANSAKADDSANLRKEEENTPEKRPLSTKRKIGFLMSLSVWVVYLAFFFYILPCRTKFCRLQKTWTFALNGVHLATKLEYFQGAGSSNLVVFGFGEIDNKTLDNNWFIAAVNENSGELLWNSTITFSPLNFKCRFEDASKTINRTECVVIGRNTIAYFDLKTGYIIWQRELLNLDTTLPEFFSVANGSSVLYAADRGMNGLYLNALDAETGFKYASVATPCEDSLSYIHRTDDGRNLLLVCQKNAVMVFWLINEKAFLKEDETKPKALYLYQLEESDMLLKIMDLPSGFCVVLTSNAVGVISTRSYNTRWVLHFFNFTVVDVTIGYFVSEKDVDVAILMENSAGDAEVRVLRSLNGEMLSSASISSRRPKALRLVPGERPSLDSVLVETESNSDSLEQDDLVTPWPSDRRAQQRPSSQQPDTAYHAIAFNEPVTVSEILTTTAVRSSVAVVPKERRNSLLHAQEIANGTTSVTEYLMSDTTQSTCVL